MATTTIAFGGFVETMHLLNQPYKAALSAISLTLTAGKFASAVQKYCWRLNTKCSEHIICEKQISFRGARNQWRRQVSEFGGHLRGNTHFGGGKIEFHEISPPPRCQNF